LAFLVLHDLSRTINQSEDFQLMKPPLQMALS
jgi:hypothetical protein